MRSPRSIPQLIEDHASFFHDISDRIWSAAEPRFHETVSSSLQQDAMEKFGFSITGQLAGMDTAFLASWSNVDSSDNESPVFAFLGEFDALPGLSQVADQPIRQPLEVEAPGQGCGHNLLGVGCMQAAVAVREYLASTGQKGSVRYYGCPGEESGAGKVFMLRAGCFDDVDVCFSWHPGSCNSCGGSTLANVRALYSFHGIPAHAAAAPYLGRSALDAAELMNTGVQYLREHVRNNVRIHYAFTDAGGDAPNMVQAEAQLLYAIRAAQTEEVREVFERVNKIARGAALMTETSVDIEIVSAYADLLDNPTLDRLALSHMVELLPLEPSAEELAYAETFLATLSDDEISTSRMTSLENGGTGSAVVDFVAKPSPIPRLSSTDVGDVSWSIPTCYIDIATACLGTPLHSWQMTAQGKSPLAHRATDAAAGILALVAMDILDEPELIDRAKADLDDSLAGRTYATLIPPEAAAGSF